MDSRLAPSTEERHRQAGLILEVTLSLGEGVAAVTFLASRRVHALTRSKSPLRGQFQAGRVARLMEVNHSLCSGVFLNHISILYQLSGFF